LTSDYKPGAVVTNHSPDSADSNCWCGTFPYSLVNFIKGIDAYAYRNFTPGAWPSTVSLHTTTKSLDKVNTFNSHASWQFDWTSADSYVYMYDAFVDEPTTISLSGLTVTVAATAKTFKRSAGSWATDGIAIGSKVHFAGFTNGKNNNDFSRALNTFTVTNITTTTNANDTLTCSAATGLVNETSGAGVVTAKVGMFYPVISFFYRASADHHVALTGAGFTTPYMPISGDGQWRYFVAVSSQGYTGLTGNSAKFFNLETLDGNGKSLWIDGEPVVHWFPSWGEAIAWECKANLYH